MSDENVAEFESAWISDDVAGLNTIGLLEVERWLREHQTQLGFGELALADSDPHGIGRRLHTGLAVLGSGPRNTHAAVEGVTELWEWLVSVDAHTLIAARAARNLWTFRRGDAPYRHGHTAVSLFTAVAGGTAGRACERAQARVAALEVAAELGNHSQIEGLLGAALQTLDLELDLCEPLAADQDAAEGEVAVTMSMQEVARNSSTEMDLTQHHGACLYLLRGFSAVLSGRYRSMLDLHRVIRVADRFAELVSSRDLLSRQVLEVRLQLARGDAAERKRVAARHIEWFRRMVAGAPGPRRYVTLMQCHDLARDTGLTAIADQLSVDLQDARNDLDLTLVRSSMPLPDDLLAAANGWLEGICSGESLEECLRRLVSDGLNALHDATDSPPIPAGGPSSWLPSVTLGPHGVPARRRDPGEDDVDGDRARWHAARVLFEADLIVVPALARIIARTTREELVELLQRAGVATGLLDGGRVQAVANAVWDWHEGRHDAALHSVVPRIEYVIRRAAELQGIRIITPTDGTSRGVHDTLGQVLDRLAGHIDESLRLHLRVLLLDDAGLNLRNDVAHGDIPLGDERTSAIAVHTLFACLFMLDPGREPH